MKKILLYILVLAAAVSCVYPFEAEVGGESHDLVVEGNIVPGTVAQFYLRYTHPLQSHENMSEGADAVLTVRDENGKVYAARRVGSALYEVDMTYASPDLKYSLNIKTENNEYATELMAVTKAPEIKELSYQLSEDNVDVVLSLDGKDDNRHYKVSFLETWEYHSDYLAKTIFDPEAEVIVPLPDDYQYEYYYCWRTRRPNEAVLISAAENESNKVMRYVIMSDSRGSKKFSIVYRMDVSVTAISDGCYEYLKNLQQSSNVSGDLFSPTPSRMESNVVCLTDPTKQVVGYVDAIQPTERRFQLDCRSVSIHKPKLILDDYYLFVPDTEELTLLDYYNFGYRPVDDRGSEGGPIYWAQAQCVDCRLEGGNKNKPEDWPTYDE